MRREYKSPAKAYSVPEFFSNGWVENRRSRPAIFIFSLAGHLAFLTLLVLTDWSALRPLPIAPEAEILSAEGERKIVWYNLARDLPPVTPPNPILADDGARAEQRSARQTIVANDPGEVSGTQKIWDPASNRILAEDVPAPNIVAASPAPERFELKQADLSQPVAEPLSAGAAPVNQQAPAPDLRLEELMRIERLRFQQQTRERTAPAEKAIDGAPAPHIDPAISAAADLERLAAFERLRFQAEQRSIEQPAARPLDAGSAPEISPQIRAGLNLEQLAEFERLRFRMTVPAASAPGRQALDGQRAPDTGPAVTPAVNLSAVYRTEALRYSLARRALTAPSSEALARIANAPAPGLTGGSAGGTAPASGSPLNEALLGARSTLPRPAPPVANSKGQGSGTGGPGAGDLAVVGLNPSANANLNVPRGRRPGRFSASPDGGGNGRIGVPGVENGASVPNLSVSPARPGTSLASIPTVVAGEGRGAWRDSEKSDGVLLALNRLTGPGSLEQLSAADLERAAKAPPSPKERAPLEDRTVHTMAINMPNISSYQGSWIVRYAQLEEEKDETPFSAPAPIRKVDPKYVAQAALEGIEGEVLLYAVIQPDGAVGDAKVMRGIDERLDQSALEAIRKWQFKPASRGGEPIAVEALFSIPFQLTGLKP